MKEINQPAEKASKQAAMRPAIQKVRLWTPVFVIITTLTFCCFVMGQGLNSGTSVFLAGRGYSVSLAGVLAMTFSLSAAVARLLLGVVIDRGKCSYVILGGIVVLVFGTLLTSVVDGAALFVVCRFLQGMGFAAATTAAATAAADVLPAERLGEGIGYYGLGQAIAMSVGPAFALFLVGTDPSTNLFVGLALVGVVGFIIALGARYERHPERLPETSGYRIRAEKAAKHSKDAAAAFRGASTVVLKNVNAGAADSGDADAGAADFDGEDADIEAPENGSVRNVASSDTGEHKSLRDALNIFEPRALPGAIPMAIICPTFGFGIFYIGLYGTTLGYANAGLFYTVSAITMIAVRLLSGRFMDSVAPIKIYLVAVICGIIAFVVLYFAAMSEAIFLVAGLPYGICLGISLPLNQSVAVKNTPSERWGATNALFLLFNDLGIGIASAIWGVINDSFGFQMSILAVIVCQVLSYFVARVVYPKDL